MSMKCSKVLLVVVLFFGCVFCQDEVEAQESEDDDVMIRIRDGSSASEGRIEIKHDGEWGTMCDDDWDLKGAIVVCKMLGFDGALEFVHSGKFGPGEGPIWLDNVHCTGEEGSIEHCEHNGFGVQDCSHHEDAGVKCNPQRLPGYFLKTWQNAAVSFDQLRLRPPRGQKKRLPQLDGYIEIFRDEKWRQVCSEGWTQENSRVVCGQLGFPNAANFLNMYQNTKTPKKKSFWLTNITCVGDESKLEECTYSTLNYTDHEPCPTEQPVLIRCVPGDSFTMAALRNSLKNAKRKHKHPRKQSRNKPVGSIRLKGGSALGEGRVEVMRDGRWGSVCQRDFDMRDANVACRHLGFGTAKRVLFDSHFGSAHGPIWLSNVQCTGTEAKLDACPHDRVSEYFTGYRTPTTGDCSHYDEVGIECHVPEMNTVKKIRIVGGRNPMEGRVEVQIGRKWGPVCSDGWGAKEAGVVCRQLGLGYALHALKEVWYYPGSEGTDALAMTGVKCKGDEMALQYCPNDGKKFTKCGDPRRTMTPFAGVICTEGSPDLMVDIPVLQDSIHMEDVGLSRLICAAEEKCLSSVVDDVDMRYTWGHRRLLRFTSTVWNRGRADFRPARLPNEWEWHACHGHFHSMGVFTHYDVLALNRTRVAEGHKASFCLEDSNCAEGISPRYDCDQPGGGTQGITVGCADTYAYNIDCQWIDITELEKGNFLLKVHVNPEHLVPETDFDNNEVLCNMKYDGQSVWVWNCHIADDYDPTIIDKWYTEAQYPGLAGETGR